MQNDIKQRWLEALRSGDYEQARGHLKHKDSDGTCTFCCLGVLADVCEVPSMDVGEGYYSFNFDGVGHSNWLPANFLDQISLSDKDMTELMAMNDSGGKSFEEIADYIDDNL